MFRISLTACKQLLRFCLDENASIAIKRITIEDGSIPETHLAALIDDEAEWGILAFDKLPRGWVLSITVATAFVNYVQVFGDTPSGFSWKDYAWKWGPPPSTGSFISLEKRD